MKENELLTISKPARYLGGEINSALKDWRRVRLKFALAFPDVYEVGMSHLGIQILYHLLNEIPEFVCERVFAPWPDMELLLRTRGLPLTSLETSRPLREFDLIGFSLQYELQYTGVLNILNLAGISLRSADRGENDPLILGGGPCALNPEPLADFFDAFVLGDGEEVTLEVCREILVSRERGESKRELLIRLCRLEGVYVPSLFHPEYEPDGRIQRIVPLKSDYRSVVRRVLDDLNRGGFPDRPILPFLEVIHDRLNVEVARGCTRGCRFCQAGMIYRPLRERSPDQILNLARSGLESTGYDEVSLLSLSTGDYSCIESLLSGILDETRGEKVAVSLPSLRVETLSPVLINRIQEVRKTGFTLAPEAGTERLRRLINKGNSEEDLLSAIDRVFSAGWRLVKLYFMIGLPTEGEDDLAGIVSLCRKAMRAARHSRGSAQINVSVSTLVPKSHTPFQWERQNSIKEVQDKQHVLRQGLERNGIRFKWTDPRLSLLEGVFARGDRRLGRVLEYAYALGCRLDGWGEHFRYELWEKALSQAGIDPFFYLRRREPEECLPWDHLESRVAKTFLQEERKKALEGTQTGDCRSGSCNGCGVCFGIDDLRNRVAGPSESQGRIAVSGESKGIPMPPHRFRCRLAKFGPAKFLGHLEFGQLMIRAFRRARIPLLYSQGFHPLPRVSFGPPLPVGHESLAEYLDFHLQESLPPEDISRRINQTLPQGVTVMEVSEIALKTPSIFDSIITILYDIQVMRRLPRERGEKYSSSTSFPVFWSRKSKEIDLKVFVESLSLAGENAVRVSLRWLPEGTLRPEEVLDFVFGWTEGNRPPMSIQKVRLRFKELLSCPMKS